MCGIAGAFSIREKIDKTLIKKMTDAIAHRGPDGEGQWLNEKENVGLGHRRLSILDLTEASAQPMHLESRYSIVFNGEIYNYLELRKDLQALGYRFKTSGDTEVLLTLYAHYGESFLKYLDGMFALAIWDEKEQALFCARDRFGEKPFYYFYDGNEFVFASEMKAIWAYGVSNTPDESKFQTYLSDSIIMSVEEPHKTFYKNINTLDAGESLLITKDLKLKINKYWDLNNIQRNEAISFQDASDQLYSILEQSVALRLRSDVTVGSSLSGGLDSSAIVALINKVKIKDQGQKTFSARFDNFEKDEGKHIEKVIGHLDGISAEYVWPSADHLNEVIDKLIYHQEEPFLSASIFAQWKVMELARNKNVTVLLDGQGADEILAGYPRYYNLYLKQLFFTNRRKYFTELNYFNDLRKGIAPAITDYRSQENFRMKVGRIKNKVLGVSPAYSNHSLQNQLIFDTQHRGLKELLRYADRNAMAHGVEVRLPFLSHKLAEFAFSLPDEYKLKNGWTKFILRDATNDILPKSIAWRVDKVGYETPQAKWLKSKAMETELSKAGKFVNDNFQIKSGANDVVWKSFILNRMLN